MKTIAGILSGVVALWCAGCASVETEEDGQVVTDEVAEMPFEVTVENRTDWPLLVRIAGFRVGEASPTGNTTLRVPRRGIAGRRVSVCVDPIGSSGRRCHSGQLVVPHRVRQIRITVPRVGQVRASVM